MKNKIKELRRGYKKAIDAGTRSGSGRLVKENFELLQEIWGGSPAVNALPSGIASMPCTEEDNTHETEQESGEEDQVEDQEVTAVDRNPVVDRNKRKHMQKPLSAHQREFQTGLTFRIG